MMVDDFFGTGDRPSLNNAASGNHASKTDLRHLEDRVDRLSLVCMAMWSLIRDKTDLTEQDLIERVKMIDRMDGKEDGKAARNASKCAKCNRPMNSRHLKCLYCGSEKLIHSAFDAI